MGRAGAGSGGGGRSSGGRSSSHSSGGFQMGSHRPGGGSRAGQGSWGHNNYGRNYGGYHSYGRGWGYVPRTAVHVYGSMSLWGRVLTMAVAAVLVLAVLFASKGSGVPASSYAREPLAGTAFSTNCVVDELGWVDNEAKTERDMQSFHKKTGVQPYVYLKAYDPELTTEEEKRAYAERFYDANIENEYTFLMVYFAEEDADHDVGYMAHVTGHEAVSVMDAEATDIFYNYWESNWYSDKSTDAVIVDSFNSTAKRILTKSSTMADGLKWLAVGVVLLIAGGIGIYFLRMKYRREKERAAETEAILHAPLHKLGDE